MIISIIIGIVTVVLKLFLSIIAPIFSAFPSSYSVSIGNGTAYMFGNIKLMDTFLPITEFFYLAGLALTLKTAIFGYKVVLYMMSLTNFVRKTFISVRM